MKGCKEARLRRRKRKRIGRRKVQRKRKIVLETYI